MTTTTNELNGLSNVSSFNSSPKDTSAKNEADSKRMYQINAFAFALMNFNENESVVTNQTTKQIPNERKIDIMSFSKIIVMGNLTKNPELRYTPKGTAVCTFSIANNDRERDSMTGEQTDRVTYFKATAWGKQAEAITQYFERGSEIYIEGKFKPEMWKDKDGKERVTFGVYVTDFNFTGGTNRNNGRVAKATVAATSQNQTTAYRNSTEFVDPDDSDIPF